MAGNKAIFDTAMKRAHDHAWANQWERALKEYDRALKEFPTERTVLRNRAQCLLRLRQWQEAEAAYSDLTKSDPSDLFALNRLAEIYLAQRQMERAIDTYNHLADRYVKVNQTHEAIRALLDLSRAIPKDKSVHVRLLKLTQEVGDRRAQVGELVALSKFALEEGDLPEAEKHADAAAALDPENPDVRKAVHAVRRKSAEETGTAGLPSGKGTTAISEATPGTALLGGTGLLQRIEPEPPESLALAEKAAEAEKKGDSTAARELYEQAVRAGAKQPAVFYSAGVLNYQAARASEAIPFLERASQDREFATSSNYMLGQCHVALEDFASAVVSFERALSGINLQKITQAEAEELLELYTAAADANMRENNPGRAASLYTNLIQIFKDRKWQHSRLPQLEKKADELYNQSIQSKLEGIGRGSGMLPGEQVAELKLDEPTRRMDEVPANELTQLMNGPIPGEATQQMGSHILPDIAGFANDQTQLMTDATSKLKGKAGQDSLQEQPGGGGSHLAPSVVDNEGQTTRMRGGPASNLRTITEYLRASDLAGLSPDGHELANGQSGGSSAYIEGQEGVPDATAMLPADQNPLTGEGHIYHTFSNAALVDMEHTSIAVQQLMAEGEYAIGMSQFEVAIDSCMAAMSIHPGYLPVHVMLGDVYVRQANTELAIDKYQTVLDTYLARREPVSAAEMCRRMLQLQPGNPSLQTRLGLLLMEGGKVDEAASALLALPESLYKAGETQRALEEALNLKKDLPNSSEVALAVGTYLTVLGRHQEALVELSRALHLDPGSNKALVRLYVLLAASNEHTQWDALQSVLERAGKEKKQARVFLEELHDAIKRDPSPTLYYGLAVMAERAGMEEIAADSLDQALLQMSMSDTSELKEASPMLEVLAAKARGDVALSAKEGALAVQLYTRALDVLKTHGGLDTVDQSMLSGDLGKKKKGEKKEKGDKKGSAHGHEHSGSGVLSAKLVSPRPQYPFLRLPEPSELYYGLAEGKAMQGEWDGAMEALEALKVWMPQDHSVHTRIADIHFRRGDLQSALGELNDLLVIYQKENENDKTLETLGHMARLAPNNVAVRRKLSDLYVKLGMTEYGLAELDVLAELQLKAGLLKDAMGSYQKAADLHFTLGQHDKAINIYERIVRLAPRDMEARQQLVNMYIQSGKVAEAVESERSMAELFSHEGQTEGAIAALHQLIALSPDDVGALHMLAQELISLGEYGQAARLYGRLLRLEPENDRNSIMHTEMLRMAREAEESKKAVSTAGASSEQRNAAEVRA